MLISSGLRQISVRCRKLKFKLALKREKENMSSMKKALSNILGSKKPVPTVRTTDNDDSFIETVDDDDIFFETADDKTGGEPTLGKSTIRSCLCNARANAHPCLGM